MAVVFIETTSDPEVCSLIAKAPMYSPLHSCKPQQYNSANKFLKQLVIIWIVWKSQKITAKNIN